MKATTALIFVIIAGALNAETPAGATDLVPRNDGPSAESLNIKDEAVVATKSDITIRSDTPKSVAPAIPNHAVIDIAALEKRIAALEAEVTSLKEQNRTLTETHKTETDERRKRSVAEEVRRRRAIRQPNQPLKETKPTEPNQSPEPTTIAVPPATAQQAVQP
jgi:hypothetical protein